MGGEDSNRRHTDDQREDEAIQGTLYSCKTTPPPAWSWHQVGARPIRGGQGAAVGFTLLKPWLARILRGTRLGEDAWGQGSGGFHLHHRATV